MTRGESDIDISVGTKDDGRRPKNYDTKAKSLTNGLSGRSIRFLTSCVLLTNLSPSGHKGYLTDLKIQ